MFVLLKIWNLCFHVIFNFPRLWFITFALTLEIFVNKCLYLFSTVWHSWVSLRTCKRKHYAGRLQDVRRRVTAALKLVEMWHRGPLTLYVIEFICCTHPLYVEQLMFVCFEMTVLCSLGGYKGFGLGMMVEVFCGILADAEYSNRIRTWKVTDRVANLVHFVCLFFCVVSLKKGQTNPISTPI